MKKPRHSRDVRARYALGEAMYRAGWSARDIAAQLGVSERYVGRILTESRQREFGERA